MAYKDKATQREYQRAWTLAKRTKKREKYVSALGGKCAKCGAVGNLDFDHIDAKTKEFPINEIWTRSETIIELEIAKCQLLCHGCHNTKTLTEQSKQEIKGKNVHGTLSAFEYCKCNLCHEARKTWNRENQRKKRKSNMPRSYNGLIR